MPVRAHVSVPGKPIAVSVAAHAHGDHAARHQFADLSYAQRIGGALTAAEFVIGRLECIPVRRGHFADVVDFDAFADGLANDFPALGINTFPQRVFGQHQVDDDSRTNSVCDAGEG